MTFFFELPRVSIHSRVVGSFSALEFCLGSFCALVAKSLPSTAKEFAKELRRFVRVGSRAHHLSRMDPYVLLHVAMPRPRCPPWTLLCQTGLRRLNVTDLSKSLAICSRTSHRLCRWCIHLSWKSHSFLSCAIPLGSPLVDVSARFFMRSAVS